MILENTNPNITKFTVDKTTHELTALEINGVEVALDNGGTIIGTLSLGDVSLTIPSEAGAVTVQNVSIKNDGEEIGKADLKITFTE